MGEDVQIRRENATELLKALDFGQSQ